MSQWALPAIAVMLIAYGALSGRLRTTPVSQAMVFVALGLLAMVGTGMRRATVGFLGWFGPRGLASIVFVRILLEQTQLPERPLMLSVVTWTVALSVYAHGLTAWPAATRYADWYHAHHERHRVMPESAAVAEQRTRGLAAYPPSPNGAADRPGPPPLISSAVHQIPTAIAGPTASLDHHVVDQPRSATRSSRRPRHAAIVVRPDGGSHPRRMRTARPTAG